MTACNDDKADVCLILEGTYPFVMGGVSSWVHRLVGKMPDLRFGIVHIAPREHYYGDRPAYALPANVVFLEEIGLLPRHEEPERRRDRGAESAIAALWQELLRLRRAGPTALGGLLAKVAALRGRGISAAAILAGEPCWQATVTAYEAEAADQSFLNFFWTWRFAWQPLVEILFRRVPRAGMYHTVSTGYAGMLATVAALAWQRPMILTEHGIYTKERRIEVYSASWIRDVDHDDLVVDKEAPYFRQFWNQHFELMSRCCYGGATRIFTLYGQNQEAQIADGADPARCEVIPNGVDIAALDKAWADACAGASAKAAVTGGTAERPFTVAFVGRVSPIKDVRTFVAAMRLVSREVPELRVRILGPMQEDPDYAERCQRFAQELQLENSVRFEGAVDIKKELPFVDVLVLTSISEAQPLVILEAGAFGVPVVATDVGSCRELLQGRTAEDQALGIGGFLTPIASPGSTARAVLELHADEELRRRMGRNLRERVRRYYGEADMISAYRRVYGDCLATPVGS
jgi:glycosyltransferase involved in cell wall biosynthesis